MRITSIMDLWERGLHIGLVGDAEVEGNVRDIRADGGGEDEDESIAWKFHRSVLSGKLRQAVCRATVGEGGEVSPSRKALHKGRETGRIVPPGEAPIHASPTCGKSNVLRLQRIRGSAQNGTPLFHRGLCHVGRIKYLWHYMCAGSRGN